MLLAVCLLNAAACGGGGGGGEAPPASAGTPTTFIGNLRQPLAAAVVDAEVAIAGATPVEVCVEGTSFCTEVDETGAFTLAADVAGDIVLIFVAEDFTARLALRDVPAGATVRIEDIACSTRTGQCVAEDVEILGEPNRAPDCSTAVAVPAVLWPPNHEMVRIAIEDVIDPDGDPLSITAIEVVADEAVDAPGSGNTAPDTQLAPLAVRAERSGQGGGRVYAIEFVADDQRGGRCRGVVEVCVPHDQGQGDTCG